MIKGKLIMAVDFAKPKKKDKQEHGKCSALIKGTWFVCQFGPGYSNTYEVSDFDDDGLKWLKDHQEVSEPPPTTKGPKA